MTRNDRNPTDAPDGRKGSDAARMSHAAATHREYEHCGLCGDDLETAIERETGVCEACEDAGPRLITDGGFDARETLQGGYDHVHAGVVA